MSRTRGRAAGGRCRSAGTPYAIDRRAYDTTIDVLGRALNRVGIDRSEKVRAFRRLSAFRSIPE